MAYNYLEQTGVIVPDASAIRAEVEAEFRARFGLDLDISPETPQGVLITAITLERLAVARNNADLANQINPNLAGGVFLDALCALTALNRSQATRSTVVATLAGVNGTVIPAGARARTNAGDFFELVNTVIIGSGGSVSGNFRSVEFGAIPAGAGELINIVDAVLGWETITNASAAVLGQGKQSDFSLRNLRRQTLALQGISTPEAIVSGVLALDGVLSMSFAENVTDAPLEIDSIELDPRSVYVCVDGGSDADIAAVLLRKKTMGAGWNGDQEVTIVEPFSGQTYTVKFDRPQEVPIMVRANVRAGSALIDAQALSVQAILDYANGSIEDEAGFVVNGNVSVWELAGAINQIEPKIFVDSLEVSTDDGMSWDTATVEIEINQVARITADDIEITVL
jgi:hypothetical protein